MPRKEEKTNGDIWRETPMLDLVLWAIAKILIYAALAIAIIAAACDL